MLETACKSIDLGSSNGLTDDEFKNIFEDLKEGLFIYEYGKSNSFVPDKELKDTYFGRYTFVRGVNSQLKFQRALLQIPSLVPPFLVTRMQLSWIQIQLEMTFQN